MSLLQLFLIHLGRIGMGLIFLASVGVDFKARAQVFNLMQMKKVPMPWFCFIGGVSWKTITSIALLANFYTPWAALFLAIYIFLANLVFNNFWAVNPEHRNFSMAMFLTNLSACFGLLAITGALQ